MPGVISHKRIIINAVSAAVQVIVVGLMYFLLYRYLIRILGPAQLGVWALVVSTSSIANFANFGITSGLVKFVADYRETSDNERMNKLIFTAFVSILLFFAILIFIGYLGVNLILRLVIGPQYIGLALRLLPYSLLCLFINEVGGIYTSILEGFQKNYVRNIIYICGSICFLVISYQLVPRYGLMGVTYAQVIQSALIFLSAFIAGTLNLKGFTLLKWNWDRQIFKSLISYGSKFQLVSLLQLLYEPATKMLLTSFGGLSAVGYYEMASRLINQVRALIVNANQVMIPVVAQASHSGMDAVVKLYQRTMSVTLLVNVPAICAVISFSSFISVIWIGHIEPAFIFPLVILSVTIFFNIMCGPAYYSSLGQGKLNLLVYVHVFMAALNIILGWILGKLFGGHGVVLAWGLTFTLGSLALIIYFQRDMLIGFTRVFSKADWTLLFTAIIFTVFAVFINVNYTKTKVIITLLTFAVVFIPLLWSNDNAKAIFRKALNV
ncbi:MAG TPA: oligosaccharide flippase family protein [Mucilaginibacter sp.]|jgi:O-antigen/teichoic acid export membrane protein|nr:oligosaccharide flippase family protein [Mucilaginibacter sp.]